MQKLIAGGTVVTASDTYAADIVIEDDHVAALLTPGTGPKDVETLDAKGCYVIPGGIDAHTHLDMPFGGTTSIDDFESGTVAAAFGGTTTLVDFAIQQKGGSLKEALDTWHAKAEGKASIDYSFHMIATDLPPPQLEEMADIVREGITSFKLFMAYPGVLLSDDQQIYRAMLRSGEIGAMITMHAETGLPLDVNIERAIAEGKTDPIYHALTRPEVAEATGTERAIALAEMAGVPTYIVHLSCQRALERVMEARDRGLPIYAETCPQYLFLTEDDLRGTEEDPFEGAKYVCTPPLRPHHHHDHLWRGLRNYDLQVVATDHCPFCMKGQKDMGKDGFNQIPNGMPGIETRLHLLYEGVREKRISLNRFVGEDLRHVPEEGHHRDRLRRRPLHLGSAEEARAVPREPAHEGRLRGFPGQGRHRRPEDGAVPWRDHRRRHRVQRPHRTRQLPQARAAHLPSVM